ncbi:MAG TPA: hypothetical protein VGI46_05545 [Candidatus Acidoferrum sp.]
MITRRFWIALLAIATSLPLQPSASAQAPAPSDLPNLLQKLIASDEIQRRQIMEQLDQVQDPDVLVPPVFAALETVEPREAWKLLDILARFPDRAKPEPLLRLARRSEEIPDTLKQQLVSIGDPARPALLKAIADTCVTWKPEAPMTRYAPQPESRQIDEGAIRTRHSIHWAAGVLSDTGSKGRNALLGMLHSRDACQLFVAQEGLTEYVLGADRPLDPQVINGLTAALSAASPAEQKAAVLVVEPMIGYDVADLSPQMTRSLFAILKAHPDTEARRAAFDLLCHADGDIPEKAAEIASHDPDESIKNSATDVLENLPHPR